jgi:hypothetical protein
VPDVAPNANELTLTVPVRATTYVPGAVMQTASLEVGTAPVDQLDATDHEPPLAFVHESVHPEAPANVGVSSRREMQSAPIASTSGVVLCRLWPGDTPGSFWSTAGPAPAGG